MASLRRARVAQQKQATWGSSEGVGEALGGGGSSRDDQMRLGDVGEDEQQWGRWFVLERERGRRRHYRPWLYAGEELGDVAAKLLLSARPSGARDGATTGLGAGGTEREEGRENDMWTWAWDFCRKPLKFHEFAKHLSKAQKISRKIREEDKNILNLFCHRLKFKIQTVFKIKKSKFKKLLLNIKFNQV